MPDVRQRALKEARPTMPPPDTAEAPSAEGNRPTKEQVVQVLTAIGGMYPEVKEEMDSAIGKLQGGATPEEGAEIAPTATPPMT